MERVQHGDESMTEDVNSDYDEDDLVTWMSYWMGVVMVLFVFVAMVITSIGSSMVRMQEEIDWDDSDDDGDGDDVGFR